MPQGEMSKSRKGRQHPLNNNCDIKEREKHFKSFVFELDQKKQTNFSQTNFRRIFKIMKRFKNLMQIY